MSYCNIGGQVVSDTKPSEVDPQRCDALTDGPFNILFLYVCSYIEDVDAAAKVGESGLVGPTLAVVGTGAIAWGFFGRPEFGDLPTRFHSLCELLSNDRCIPQSLSTRNGISGMLQIHS